MKIRLKVLPTIITEVRDIHLIHMKFISMKEDGNLIHIIISWSL
uniref:Uncharacterized protein n=1 Tax=Arundo donax TaxID=35708 RepID=A0A0A9F0I8_ARUDO